jgi:LPXTG-site transpeptidase (sortase) family protein
MTLNGGADDSRVSFRVTSGSRHSGSSDPDDVESVKQLPATGFAPGKISPLSDPPFDYYNYSDLRMEIPRLGVDTSIMGVPVSSDGAEWDVSWLGRNVGWLNGTAFPSYAGNSVITGHVWDADNLPGIFVDLKKLTYGDTVVIHTYGQVFTYEVRETMLVLPEAIREVLKHEDNPWVTLVTCEEYDAGKADYASRRVVRAVLVDVEEE